MAETQKQYQPDVRHVELGCYMPNGANPGEIVGLDPREAKRLVDKGIARYAKVGDKPKRPRPTVEEHMTVTPNGAVDE